MKFIYTDAADVEFSKMSNSLKKDLEDYVKREKYVFGDEDIEITGSDVRGYFQVHRKIKNNSSKFFVTNFIASAYILLGLMLTVGGVYYDFFINMVRSNPQQLIIIMSGFMMVLLGISTFLYMKKKEREFRYLTIRDNVNKKNNTPIKQSFKYENLNDDMDKYTHNIDLSMKELREYHDFENFVSSLDKDQIRNIFPNLEIEKEIYRMKRNKFLK